MDPWIIGLAFASQLVMCSCHWSFTSQMKCVDKTQEVHLPKAAARTGLQSTCLAVRDQLSVHSFWLVQILGTWGSHLVNFKWLPWVVMEHPDFSRYVWIIKQGSSAYPSILKPTVFEMIPTDINLQGWIWSRGVAGGIVYFLANFRILCFCFLGNTPWHPSG